jgi:hypothetical protein
MARLGIRGKSPCGRLKQKSCAAGTLILRCGSNTVTPRRVFAQKVLKLYEDNQLDTATMDALVEQEYRVAVITIEEDRILNKMARSKVLDTPEERWRAAGIEF